MGRIFFPVLMGVVGVAILVWLGVWQMQRLSWKQDILSQIDARIAAAPIAIPTDPTEEDDEYLSVHAEGVVIGDELHVLSSGTGAGTGYRVITAFATSEGRRILLDQGILPLADKALTHSPQQVQLTGSLVWPDDKTSSTPVPDLPKNIWFARDVLAMSAHLDTEPVLVILRSASAYDPRLIPVPVNSAGITNDHREYMITWFLLALVWAAMSLLLIRRQLRKA